MNNITLSKLYLSKLHHKCPVFTLSSRISKATFNDFSIFYSATPFLNILTKHDDNHQITLHKLNIRHFIEKTIISTSFNLPFKSSNGNIISFSCCLFNDVTSDKQGSLFDLTNNHVTICKCTFSHISSTSFPSCFLLDSCTFEITHSSFTECFAKGGDGKFGNGFYTYKSANQINYTSLYHCSPYPSNDYGDSAIEAFAATSVHYHYSNATENYGKNGASSISLWKSTAQINYISFNNNINSCEHNCIETRITQKNVVSHMNFINSTRNLESVFHNAESSLEIDNCAFIECCEIFGIQNNVEMDNCISDNNIFQNFGSNNKIVDKDSRISLSFNIVPYCICTKMNNNCIYSLFCKQNIFKFIAISLVFI